MGEVINLSEETDRNRIDFLRGIKDGMPGKDLKGTWESLLYTPKSKRRSLTWSKAEFYKAKPK